MFQAHTTKTSGFRLTAVALLATSVAGCSSLSSLNPFGNDDQSSEPTPVSRPAQTAPQRSQSLYGDSGSAQQTTYTQRLEPISESIPIAPGAPDQYTVQEGDTLWDIASTFLSDPWYWPEVWYVNPQVENPHLIYPGDVLALVTIDGQPRITTARGSAYRLSPQARITPLEESIQTIAYEDIAAFLSRGLVLERDQLNQLPYILATREDHIIAAAGNDIYIRGGSPAPTGTRFSVVHVGDELVDPDDGKTVGYQAQYVGEGVMSRGGDPATVTLTDTSREALLGDRLIQEEDQLAMNFFPKAPSYEVDGRIISVVDGVSLIGQYQVVVVNRGSRDGLEPGDVLDIYQTGDVVRDRFSSGFLARSSGGEKVRLPDEQAGTVMMFKVYDRIGYGLVMEATTSIRVLDTIRNPG